MKKLFPYLGWILLILFLWLKGCGTNNLATAPKTKVITKTLTTKGEIKHVPIYIPNYYKDEKEEKKLRKELGISKESLENYKEELDNAIDEFTHANDSLKAELYAKANTLNYFDFPIEDEFIRIENKGIAQGKIKEFNSTYTFKAQPVQEVKFRLLAGAGLGNTILFDKPIFNANLGFQNSKGNILRVGYDSEKRVLINYDFSIFKIRK